MHRWPCLVWIAVCGAGCGGAQAKQAVAPGAAGGPAPAPIAADPGTRHGAAALPDEKLVITGSVEMEVDDGEAAVATIRAAVEKAGGRLVHDEQSGRGHDWTAHLTVRLPPGDVDALLEQLGAIGRVVSRRLEATDVSRTYFDQEIALQNLRLTLERLQKLLGGPDLKTADVLQIEQELTRVRGEIERLEGEHRYLTDRIAYATIDLRLTGTGTHLVSPTAHLYPGVRGSLLVLVDAPDGVDRVRPGVTATLWFMRASSLELSIYPSTDDGTGRAVMATTGGGGYSDFFGAGRRRVGNPYLGARIGYAWVEDRHNFVAAGEVGVELVKTQRLILDVSARGLGLFGKGGTDAAAEVTAGLLVPF